MKSDLIRGTDPCKARGHDRPHLALRGHDNGGRKVSRIVVSQFVSVDGVIEDPVGIETLGRGAWSGRASSGDEGGKMKVDEIMDADAVLLGRNTYDGFFAAWPSRGGDYADKINSMPKYVVSSTLENAEWQNTTVLKGDVASEVGKLREQPGGDILIYGSAQLTDALLEHDLVDEWRLMVFPIIVGAGKRCFGDPGKAVDLNLVDSRTVGEGVQILVYQPARD
jgi:dihydrofolate reductase